jgi:hypothetical protein
MTDRNQRKVTLRDVGGMNARYLWAYLDDQGNLHIDGQDLGPATAMVSGDGEYEWFQVIDAADIPRVVRLLDGKPGTDILDLLEQKWTGGQAGVLEQRLQQSDIPIKRSTWSG